MTKSEKTETMLIDKRGLDFLRQEKIKIDKEKIYTGQKKGAFFVFMTGAKSGETVVPQKPKITIGRDEGADIIINKQFVSKKHAEILTVGGKTMIVDKSSTNGTFVNDLQIKEAYLKDLDEVQIGNVVIKFFKMDLDTDNQQFSNDSLDSDQGESQFYAQVFNECVPFFGKMTAQFLNRQITAHIKKTPDTIMSDDKKELSKWIKISAGLLLDDAQATTLSDKIMAV